MLVLFHIKAKGNVIRFYFTSDKDFNDAKKIISFCDREHLGNVINDFTDMTVDAHFSFDVEVNDSYTIRPLLVFGEKDPGSGNRDIVVDYNYGNTVSEVMTKLGESMGIVDNFEIIED